MEELAYCRPPSPAETAKAEEFLTQFRTRAVSSGLNPSRAEAEAWLSYARVILAANEFVYVD